VRTRKTLERSAPASAAAKLNYPRDKAPTVSVHDPVQVDGSQPQVAVSNPPADYPPWVACLMDRMEKLDAKVSQLLQQRTIKDWYGTEEVAQLLGKADFTVREWCRNGRVNAQKRGSGRGKFQSWVISREELQRLQREGLLPINRKRTGSPASP
jgi:hypothetical protein